MKAQTRVFFDIFFDLSLAGGDRALKKNVRPRNSGRSALANHFSSSGQVWTGLGKAGQVCTSLRQVWTFLHIFVCPSHACTRGVLLFRSADCWKQKCLILSRLVHTCFRNFSTCPDLSRLVQTCVSSCHTLRFSQGMFAALFGAPGAVPNKEILEVGDVLANFDANTKAVLVARLPKKKADAAIAQLQAANPTIDFTINGIKTRAKYLERAPAQYVRYKSSIDSINRKMEKQSICIRDYEALQPIDKDISRLRDVSKPDKRPPPPRSTLSGPVFKKRRTSTSTKQPLGSESEYEPSESEDDGDELAKTIDKLPAAPLRNITNNYRCVHSFVVVSVSP